MSFTDGKRFIATVEDVKGVWGGGFKCRLCGHKFAVGDGVRFVYMHGKVKNALVCDDCDGPTVKTDLMEQAHTAGLYY